MFYPSCGEHVDHYNAKAVCCCSDLRLVTPTLFVFFVGKWNIQPTDTVYTYFIEHELGIHIFEVQLPWRQWPNIKLLFRGVASSQSFNFSHVSRDINRILLKVALTTITNHYILYRTYFLSLYQMFLFIVQGQIKFRVKIYFCKIWRQ